MGDDAKMERLARGSDGFSSLRQAPDGRLMLQHVDIHDALARFLDLCQHKPRIRSGATLTKVAASRDFSHEAGGLFGGFRKCLARWWRCGHILSPLSTKEYASFGRGLGQLWRRAPLPGITWQILDDAFLGFCVPNHPV